jgi:hypothetical protein
MHLRQGYREGPVIVPYRSRDSETATSVAGQLLPLAFTVMRPFERRLRVTIAVNALHRPGSGCWRHPDLLAVQQ